MTTVWTDLRPLVSQVQRALEEAIDDRVEAAKARAPRESGRFANSITGRVIVKGERLNGRVYSDIVYAGALERGAWVRKGRGPHISRAHAPRSIGKAMRGFNTVFRTKLKEENLKARRRRK